MGWGDDGGAGFASPFDGEADLHALLVDGDGDEAALGGAKGGFLQRVAGLFHPDGIAGVEEDAGGDVERLLGAGDDHDLVGCALHAASGAEIVGDRFAKAFDSKGIDVVNGTGVGVAAVAGDEAGPEAEGELVEGGLMNAEGPPAAERGEVAEGGVEGGSRRDATRASGREGRRIFRQRNGHALFGERCGDEGAGADFTGEVALGEKLRVGVENRETGDAELRGQLAGGGNAFGGAQLAAQNGGAKAIIDLLMERVCGIAVDGEKGKEDGGAAGG